MKKLKEVLKRVWMLICAVAGFYVNVGQCIIDEFINFLEITELLLFGSDEDILEFRIGCGLKL